MHAASEEPQFCTVGGERQRQETTGKNWRGIKNKYSLFLPPADRGRVRGFCSKILLRLAKQEQEYRRGRRGDKM